MKKIVSFTAAFFSAMSSFSANAVWEEGKILSVQNNNASHVILKWTTDAPYQCLTSNQIILRPSNFSSDATLGEEMFNRAYIGVLQAVATQKPVRFELDGCDGNSMKAKAVQICATDPCVP